MAGVIWKNYNWTNVMSIEVMLDSRKKSHIAQSYAHCWCLSYHLTWLRAYKLVGMLQVMLYY